MPTYVALPAYGTVPLLSQAFSAASVSVTFGANQYKRIDINIDWNGGTLSSVALTGMAAGSYNQEQTFGSNAIPGAAGVTGANNWAIAAATGAGTAHLSVSMPPAPARKGMTLSVVQTGGTMVGLQAFCVNTDTTNDPSAVVIAFDALRVGYVYAIGYV